MGLSRVRLYTMRDIRCRMLAYANITFDRFHDCTKTKHLLSMEDIELCVHYRLDKCHFIDFKLTQSSALHFLL